MLRCVLTTVRGESFKPQLAGSRMSIKFGWGDAERRVVQPWLTSVTQTERRTRRSAASSPSSTAQRLTKEWKRNHDFEACYQVRRISFRCIKYLIFFAKYSWPSCFFRVRETSCLFFMCCVTERPCFLVDTGQDCHASKGKTRTHCVCFYITRRQIQIWDDCDLFISDLINNTERYKTVSISFVHDPFLSTPLFWWKHRTGVKYKLNIQQSSIL